MSVEIWSGVCDRNWDTTVTVSDDGLTVYVEQEGLDFQDRIVMARAEAIDIALCLLRDLVPGYVNTVELQVELAKWKSGYYNLANNAKLLPPGFDAGEE